MKIRSLDNFSCPHKTAVALGTFDGLHLGHCAVIHAACNHPALSSVVLSVVSPRQEDLLITPKQCEQLLAQKGVDYYLPVPLAEIQELSAEEFFHSVLLKTLGAAHLVCGFNFRFGKGAAGDTHLLQQLCHQAGVALTVIQPVEYDQHPISSSRIRTALKEGNLPLANGMLGRAYGFEAPVLHGQHLGRKLGFPTINQAVPGPLTIPKNGVYAVAVTVNNATYGGVCNIGRHPTVGNLTTPLAETYVLDFDGDLYNQSASLSFLSFLRTEETFSSLTALQNAIENDVKQARLLFD